MPRSDHLSRLRDRVAVVTGGSGGIGRAVCQALAAEGARVVVVGRDRERVEQSAQRAREAARAFDSSERVLGLSAIDVRDERSVARMVDRTLDRFGRIDALVASAGVSGSGASSRMVPQPVVALETATWAEVVDTNLKGVFLCNRAVIPVMKRQGGGQIINVSSSRGGTAGRPYAAAYCASKFGVRGLSQALLEEVRGHGIRVQVLLPDAVDTPLIRGTRLAPFGALPPARVAELVIRMLTLPEDALLTEPIIAPYPLRSASRDRIADARATGRG